LIRFSGVAALTASAGNARPFGMFQLVIAAGKLMSRKARPINAGFKGFAPNPPKNSFATTMAKAAPSATIQSGVPGGRTSASRNPLTTAEKSPIVVLALISFRNRNSDNTADVIEVTMTPSAARP